MNRLIFVLPLLFISWLCQAQDDHLNPEQGYFSSYKYQDDYYSRIRHIMYDSVSNQPAVRVVVVPSFVPEYMITIDREKTGTEFVLTYRTVSRSIWSEQYKAKNYATIKVKERKQNLPQPLASLLISLAETAVNQTRYPEKRSLGSDGVNYHISTNNAGLRGGYTWSPRQSSLMSELVVIIDQLPKVALSPQSATSLEKLSTDAQRLLQKLQAAQH